MFFFCRSEKCFFVVKILTIEVNKLFCTWRKRMTQFCIILSCILFISNSMVSRAIWKNTHSWVFQLKTSNSTRPSDSCYFDSLWKTCMHLCIITSARKLCFYLYLSICLFVCLSPGYRKKYWTVVHLEGVDAFCYNTRFPHWLFHIYPLFYRYCFYSSRIFVTFHCTEYLKKHTINVNEMQRITSLEVMRKQGMDVHCFVWIW